MEDIKITKKYELESDDFKEIDIVSILSIFSRNKNIIYITALLGTVIGLISAFMQTPIYSGRFQVVVDSNGKNSVDNSQNKSFNEIVSGSFNSTLKTEELILKSPFVLRPVYQYTKNKYQQRNDPKQNLSFRGWSEKTLAINFSKGTNVLNISFRDNEPTLILSTLEKIISQYQNYSKLSRDKNLKKGFDFLTKQQKILQEKSSKSLRALNQFTIDNGLGDVDGFVSLGSSNPIGTRKNFKEFLGNKEISEAIKSETKAGQRFDDQFKLLKKYEAEYLDYSSILKPNSSLLKNLKIKIDNLKESLKRPNEILLKYKELSRIAGRDEILLNRVEDDLAFTNLEIARQKDPWAMIFEPTIDDVRVSPKRGKITLFYFLGSFVFGGILAYLKDKSSGKIYDRDNLKRLINCQFIDCIGLNTEELSKKIIYKLIESKTKENYKTALVKTYFVNTFSNEDDKSKNLTNNLLENEKNKLVNLQDAMEIDNAEYLIFFINKNNIKKKDISLINKYISLYSSKILGWFLLEEN